MNDSRRLQRAALLAGGFVALLWLVQILAAAGDWNLTVLGVRPGAAPGLIGVITAPLVHGSWGHLFGNTLPLLVIGTAMLYGLPRSARFALPVIWLASGLAVWLLARPSVHLGASGLAYGMMFYLLTAGLARRDPRSIAITLIVLFLHGGMIWGVLPLAAGVSFEYHAAGAFTGILAAVALHRRDPVPPRPRKYAWEGEEIDLEHPAADLFRGEADERRPKERD
jgi:membrane associated rhomboid family serine protease